MADMLPLRAYQRGAVDAVFRAHADGMRRPAVVLPTGGGKTVVFSHASAEYHAREHKRVLVLVHRDELADQALDKLRAVAPHLSAGKVKAWHNDTAAQVVVASVPTLSRPARLASLLESQQRYRPFGFIITDECHHAVAPSYQRVYAAFPDADHMGCTATMARGDGIGLGSVWEAVVYSKSLAYMISKGYLVPPVGRSVAVDDLDLSAVKQSRGDYQAGDLGHALEDSHALAQIAAAYKQHAPDRPGVVFTPTVATAHGAREELEAVGITSAVISGETPREDRRRILADRRAGRIQVLSNCMVLTEGFDDPGLSCAVIARPTASQPLYVQMVGRVLRPFPGKLDALVLDVVGASETNKLATLVDLEEGLFPERKPCRTCFEIPCVCPCKVCGADKGHCECEPEEEGAAAAADLVLKGTGAVLDLFASSRSAWLQTRRGVWFIPTGESHIILWPEAAGTWTVADVPRGGTWTPLHGGVNLEAAMSWGEVEAEDRDDGPFGQISTRAASWRRRKSPPSQAQLDKAARMRIMHAPDVTKAELSDMISVAVASRLIDPYVPQDAVLQV